MCSRVRYWSSISCECLKNIISSIENGCDNKKTAGIHTINVVVDIKDNKRGEEGKYKLMTEEYV